MKRDTLWGSISAIFTICIISPFSMEINIYGTRNKTAPKGGPPFQLGFVVQGSKQIIRNPGKQTSQKFFVLTKMAEKMKCWHIHSSWKKHIIFEVSDNEQVSTLDIQKTVLQLHWSLWLKIYNFRGHNSAIFNCCWILSGDYQLSNQFAVLEQTVSF